MTVTIQGQLKQSRFLSFGTQLICDLNLSTIIGKNEAVLLQQLYYWLSYKGIGKEIFGDGRKWIYNTYKDWAKQLGWSTSTVRRVIKNLEDLRILISCKPEKSDGYHRKSYSIDFNILKNFSNNNPLNPEQIGCVQNEQIIIETENTCIISISSEKKNNENRIRKQPKEIAKFFRRREIHNSETKQNRESKFTETNQIIYKLVEIYNKHIEGEKVTLNKRLAKWLMAAFQKLGSCLKKWENFCKRIVTSDWLMGRITDGFKVSLAWLLRFNVIDRILGGDFQCKEPYEESPVPTQEDEQLLIYEIENSEASVDEQSVKKTLLKTFGVARFKSYFAQAKVRLENGNVILLIESMFHRDQIDTPSMWGKIITLYPKAVLRVDL